jgi:hypothetical protein
MAHSKGRLGKAPIGKLAVPEASIESAQLHLFQGTFERELQTSNTRCLLAE